LTKSPGARVVQQFIAGLFDVCMKLMDLVLKLAPLGVGALMFAMTARVGLGVLLQLGAYVGVVVLGLGLHLFVVYGAGVQWLGGDRPSDFFATFDLHS
jgi:DAACS family dicarboxylate/amino acid:cation (Na+ or H+) symporter